MTLVLGTRLGSYEILSALGAGGMGEVYRARDTKLDRDVAIKVLPELFVSDPERVARFQREAKTLASLNHPNIAAIYGIEESQGVSALVMEFVEGEDVSQRIARGAIPLDETLPIARQIAEALEAAHEQGIIHRDLKPANIKVRADGTVKVLDFGLAKALEPAAGSSPSMAMSPTITPEILRCSARVCHDSADGCRRRQLCRTRCSDGHLDARKKDTRDHKMHVISRACRGQRVAQCAGVIQRPGTTDFFSRGALAPSWKCPACQTQIRHDGDRPERYRVYRCHVCRLELVLDESTQAMTVAPLPALRTRRKSDRKP